MHYHKTIFVFVALFSHLLVTASAEGLPDGLFACRALDGDAERLACYDGLADRQYGQRASETSAPASNAAAAPAPAVENERVSETSAPESNAAAPAAAVENLSQEDVFGLSGDEIREAYGIAEDTQDPNELTATITDIQSAAHGRIFVWLDNGQVWRQKSASALKIKVGDRVVIKKGALGSFKMKKEGSSVMMRVNREQ